MKEKRRSESLKKSFKLIWGITMIFIYLSVAYLLVFTPLFRKNIPEAIRIAFGIIFAVYGILRGYRLWKE